MIPPYNQREANHPFAQDGFEKDDQRHQNPVRACQDEQTIVYRPELKKKKKKKKRKRKDDTRVQTCQARSVGYRMKS